MTEENNELPWRHSGYTKTGWVKEKDRQNGEFFRTKLREFFIEFSDIPKHKAVDYSLKEISNWLDENEVLYKNPSDNKLIIYSEKLKVGIGITFTQAQQGGDIHYQLVHLNLEKEDDNET